MSTTEIISRDFDMRVTNAVKYLIGIDNLSTVQRMLLHLPVRNGGLGITSYELIAEAAYQASLEDGSQFEKVQKINNEMISRFDAATLLAIKQFRRPHASDWLNFPVIKANNDKLAALFSQSVKQRLLSFDFISAAQCLCGFKGNKVELGTHILGCSKISGSNTSWRHNVVKMCIADFCRTNFIPASVEPVIVKNPEDGKHNRADLRISLLQRSQEVYVDIVVANQLSQSHKGKSNARVEHEKERDKESKYLREVQARSGEFVTMLIEVNGGFSPQAATLVNNIERMCGQEGALYRAISTSLQNANAQLLINAARMM